MRKNRTIARVVLGVSSAMLIALSAPAFAHHREGHNGGQATPPVTESPSSPPVTATPSSSPTASPQVTVPPVPPLPRPTPPSPDAGCAVTALSRSLPIGGDPPLSSLRPFAPLNAIGAVFCLL